MIQHDILKETLTWFFRICIGGEILQVAGCLEAGIAGLAQERCGNRTCRNTKQEDS